MAKLKLTEGQQAIVDYRGGSMLVSAAAGSGKTMVLVQRLLSRICDPLHPCNVDDFLIITYTKKAAAELRTKIMEALSNRLADEPENRHLRRQMQRIYHAQISTVHAFCAELLRTYANKLSISPDFRIAEESESAAMRRNVVEQLLESVYETVAQEPDIGAAIDLFGAGRDDRELPDMILHVYAQARCSVDPEKCLDDYLAQQDFSPNEDASNTVWGAWLCDRVREFAVAQAALFEPVLEEMVAYPAYEKANGDSIRATVSDLRTLATSTSWDEIAACQVRFDRLKPVKDATEIRDMVVAVRDPCKEAVKKMLQPFSARSEAVLQDLAETAPAIRGLVALTRSFSEAYDREKARRGVLDFGDLEHLTLRLLYGSHLTGPTGTAAEISARFAEVMVDEYQDTNAVQDRIFCGVSNGGERLFMVGDVKQSIYRFRMADPTIFLEKYRDFSDYVPGCTGPRRFFLSENFRSQAAILDAANHVFSNVMSEQVGDICYAGQQMLRAGTTHPVIGQPCVELHCLVTTAPEEEESPDKAKAEAQFVARRIQELLQKPAQVSDGDGTRPVRPGDIVILLRALSAADIYMETLSAAGIPVTCERAQSILETTEISVLLSFLKIIDNPHQDIPLLSVLTSPLFSFTPDELAKIRCHDRQVSIYDAMQLDDQEKTQHFLTILKQLRADAAAFSPAALTEHLLRSTSMEEIFSTLEGGMQRRQNLRQFADYVRASETVSPTLGAFSQQVASVIEQGGMIPVESGAAADCVTIMTVHKSKGLEFPVVFLADLSRKFNDNDLKETVLLHPALGIGAMGLDREHQIRYPTLARSAISDRIRRENRSEELRVLYVAMTRAKDLLIMTHCSRYLTSELQNLSAALTCPVPPVRSGAVTSPGQWILMAALCRKEATALFDVATRPDCFHTGSDEPWVITLQQAGENPALHAATDVRTSVLEAPPSDTVLAQLSFSYPDLLQTVTPAKITPTQLKGRVEDLESAEDAQPLQAPLQVHVRQPSFAQPTKLSPTERGEAVHLALQFLDFSQCTDLDSTKQAISALVTARHLTEEQAASVEPAQILGFLTSPLGKRMQASQSMMREFKFSVLADGTKFGAYGGSLLLQGVVDCCWEEPDGLVILDFKTDRIRASVVEDRAERYHAQLQAYRYAMEQVMERPVQSCWLYFLEPGCAVEVKKRR
jgi:ATP-dependent helicase/nuclease subunit A